MGWASVDARPRVRALCGGSARWRSDKGARVRRCGLGVPTRALTEGKRRVGAGGSEGPTARAEKAAAHRSPGHAEPPALKRASGLVTRSPGPHVCQPASQAPALPRSGVRSPCRGLTSYLGKADHDVGGGDLFLPASVEVAREICGNAFAHSSFQTVPCPSFHGSPQPPRGPLPPACRRGAEACGVKGVVHTHPAREPQNRSSSPAFVSPAKNLWPF